MEELTTTKQFITKKVIEYSNGEYFLMGKELSPKAYDKFVEQLTQMADDNICMVSLGASPTDKTYDHISFATMCGMVKTVFDKEDGLYVDIYVLETQHGISVFKDMADVLGAGGFILQTRGYSGLVIKNPIKRFLNKINSNWFKKADVYIKDEIQIIGFDIAPIPSYKKTDAKGFGNN